MAISNPTEGDDPRDEEIKEGLEGLGFTAQDDGSFLKAAQDRFPELHVELNARSGDSYVEVKVRSEPIDSLGEQTETVDREREKVVASVRRWLQHNSIMPRGE